jgi:DNA-binding XRE family transcriptional regulator
MEKTRKQIAQLRKLGFSDVEIAKESGISRQTIVKIKNGGDLLISTSDSVSRGFRKMLLLRKQQVKEGWMLF